jgi:esterase/lipase superfamily enzyme
MTLTAFNFGMSCRVATLSLTFAISFPAVAAADPPLAKPLTKTTVFFVTDQQVKAGGEETNGFAEDRYNKHVGTCADPQAPWSEDCPLQYGYVQWDATDHPGYYALAKNDFYTAIGAPARALIFIHGFNEKFSNAIADGRNFALWLDSESGVIGEVPVIVYGWPAPAAAVDRLKFPFEYPNDETNNAWTRLHLLAFFGAFRRQTHQTRLSVVAHSMGNRLALEMLLSLREEQLTAQLPVPAAVAAIARAIAPGYRLAHFISLEPDVDTQTFAEAIAVLQPSAVDDVTVYGNPGDLALKLSETLHHHCRAGLIGCDPLYAGQFAGSEMPPWLNVIDAQAIASACDRGIGHSYYQSNFMLTDISDIVLDRSTLMTKDSLREGIRYADRLGNKPLPHFWIDVNTCRRP